jgi:hypothetical protein
VRKLIKDQEEQERMEREEEEEYSGGEYKEIN